MPQWTGDKFLDQFVDDGLPVDPSWTPDAERSRQLDRLVPQAAITGYVSIWAGRLSAATNTRQERAMDKKISRRVASRLGTAIATWGGDRNLIDEYIHANLEEIQRKAAVLTWPEWWQDHKVHITACLRHVATQSRKNGYIRDGNKFVNALSNEYRSLDDVLGTLVSES